MMLHKQKILDTQNCVNSGVQWLSCSYPGGIARCRGLNHRLMALNPPGSLPIVDQKHLHAVKIPLSIGGVTCVMEWHRMCRAG